MCVGTCELRVVALARIVGQINGHERDLRDLSPIPPGVRLVIAFRMTAGLGLLSNLVVAIPGFRT
jgi:hypothetical protein